MDSLETRGQGFSPLKSALLNQPRASLKTGIKYIQTGPSTPLQTWSTHKIFYGNKASFAFRQDLYESDVSLGPQQIFFFN